MGEEPGLQRLRDPASRHVGGRHEPPTPTPGDTAGTGQLGLLPTLRGYKAVVTRARAFQSLNSTVKQLLTSRASAQQDQDTRVVGARKGSSLNPRGRGRQACAFKRIFI